MIEDELGNKEGEEKIDSEEITDLDDAQPFEESDIDEETDAEELSSDDSQLHSGQHLSGMFERWFLDYASYTILERAVPYVNDGLKPVQRRILHAMKEMDDGRFNKVANIVGQAMQYHPHGDASIADALVQLGQKDYLIDCQGNWGNILTGDSAAASRYIEARLSPFALDVAFNAKTTNWKLSYDGRKREPVTLPVKFPLLLIQGVEGIAVGLSVKILPHNFNEVIDAAVAYLRGQNFTLYPDFPTGGMIDISRYNDGHRGGQVRIRARIEKDPNNRILRITEIPFGRTTQTLIDSILKANDKGKIKIKKIDDNTSDKVEIEIQLAPGVSSDKTIDALYACSDCELPISPNACVIEDEKPVFSNISEILKRSADDTVTLLKLELEIHLNELRQEWTYCSLEKIFIEQRIYKDKPFEESETMEAVLAHVWKRLKPFIHEFEEAITDDDVKKLLEIRMKRILKFSTEEADRHIRDLQDEMERTRYDIENIIPYTIRFYQKIKLKYGKNRLRKTEIRSFENIRVQTVVAANEKLYVNYEEGFAGTNLKKDEFVCECSSVDDMLIIRRDGSYQVMKVVDKVSIGKDVIHVSIYRKNEDRTVFNLIYRDGKNGPLYAKRFNVKGVMRDKEYNLTKGTPGSRIMYMSANPNGEAETVKVYFKPRPNLKKLSIDFDFANLSVKGRTVQGNLVTKIDVHRIQLSKQGASTLGGLDIYLDEDILRLNTENRGRFLGSFDNGDRILVVLRDGTYYTTDYALTNHYEEYVVLEKWDPEKIWTAVFFDQALQFYYLKRFTFEESSRRNSFVGEGNTLTLISQERYPQFELLFGGKNASRPSELLDAEAFIGVKTYKAHGKRLSGFEVMEVREVEPLQKEEVSPETPETPEPIVAEPMVETPADLPLEPSVEVPHEAKKKPAKKEAEPEDEDADGPVQMSFDF